MTKTEEKAKEWSENHFDEDYRGAAFISYVKGADDQRSIDIDKACEWWVQHFASNCILKHDYDRCMEKIDEFRKAMEQLTH